MKVPIYQNRVSLPKTSGVGQLSVQANPQAMSAGSRAQAQFGQTLVAGGINWYEDFVKLDQAQEQATETSKFDKFISNATTANLRTHPSDWKNKIKARNLWRAWLTKVDRIVYRFMGCSLRLDLPSH